MAFGRGRGLHRRAMDDIGSRGGNPHRRTLPQLLRLGMIIAQEGIFVISRYWPADHLDVLDHALHPDSALVDRVDLATPLSLSSRLVSRLLPPRGGLERSDFVLWPVREISRTCQKASGHWGHTDSLRTYRKRPDPVDLAFRQVLACPQRRIRRPARQLSDLGAWRDEPQRWICHVFPPPFPGVLPPHQRGQDRPLRPAR
jgi:hypothetical protein